MDLDDLFFFFFSCPSADAGIIQAGAIPEPHGRLITKLRIFREIVHGHPIQMRIMSHPPIASVLTSR